MTHRLMADRKELMSDFEAQPGSMWPPAVYS